MDYHEFISLTKEKSTKLSFDGNTSSQATLLNNEALFHLPLLAITILVLSKDRRKPNSEEVGQLVGECLEETLRGFKGSAQHLGWSANLRMRTVRALTFLEAANLIVVDKKKHLINSTDFGHKVIDTALSEDTNLSLMIRDIARAYRNICIEKQLDLQLI